MASKTRTETNCRNVNSKDGTFSPHFNVAVSERLTKYCKLTNQNRTKVAETCVMKQLDILEREFLEDKSKEELIDLLLMK